MTINSINHRNNKVWEMFVGDERAEVKPLEKLAVERIVSWHTISWLPVINQEGPPERRIPHRRVDTLFFPTTPQSGLIYSSTMNLDIDGKFSHWLLLDMSVYTWLATVKNPESQLYKKTLTGNPLAGTSNACAFYGLSCGTYTNAAWRNNSYSGSTHWQNLQGVGEVPVQSAQSCKPGDLLWFPGHTMMVSNVTKDQGGNVTHVSLLESTAGTGTTRQRIRTAAQMNSSLNGSWKLVRILDKNAFATNDKSYWMPLSDISHPDNINEVLLLDQGDKCNYGTWQTVEINIMDENAQSLVVMRNGQVIEQVDNLTTGVIERNFPDSGDYSAYCIMADNSHSQAVEWIMCKVDFTTPASIERNSTYPITFSCEKCWPIWYFMDKRRSTNSSVSRHYISRQAGRAGSAQITDMATPAPHAHSNFLMAENRFGRVYSEQKPISVT